MEMGMDKSRLFHDEQWQTFIALNCNMKAGAWQHNFKATDSHIHQRNTCKRVC